MKHEQVSNFSHQMLYACSCSFIKLNGLDGATCLITGEEEQTVTHSVTPSKHNT